MSIAYLLGKVSSKWLRVKINIPLLMVLSILPDADIIFDRLTGAQLHRGPSHSAVVAIIAFIPFFIVYRKKAVPYFLALISHSLIGDFFIGGNVQLLWPFSSAKFGFTFLSVFSPINIVLELTLFLLAMLVLYKSGDWKVFLTDNKSNLLLIIPICTVLLPTIIGYPFSTPLLISEPILAIAHLIYLVLFAIAVIKSLYSLSNRRFKHSINSKG